MTRTKKNKRKMYMPALGCFGVLLLLAAVVVLVVFIIPLIAIDQFGLPAENLSPIQKIQYSAKVLLAKNDLLSVASEAEASVTFKIEPGESAYLIAQNLESAGLIRSSEGFVAYLTYSGKDIGLQQGEFLLDRGKNSLEIAAELQNPIPTKGRLVILPGWRLEEIAASIPTSGLEMSPEDFLNEARNSSREFAYIPVGGSVEGYLLPSDYTFERNVSPAEMIAVIVNSFEQVITPDLMASFEQQGLTVGDAVILASILQREAMVLEEQPMMASVFLNRLNMGMKLDSDPTVQYSVGVPGTSDSWWKVPLSKADLSTDSAFNTYIYSGLPPGPICSPDIDSLSAVANPESSNYLYFQAKCDGSGYHNFAETFEEHVSNSCNN